MREVRAARDRVDHCSSEAHAIAVTARTALSLGTTCGAVHHADSSQTAFLLERGSLSGAVAGVRLPLLLREQRCSSLCKRRYRVNRRDVGDTKRMAPRPLTEAAVLKQLKTVGGKLAGSVSGEKRLALLRRQADLGDQRDEAADKARKAK
jgi:hypothetical protein